MKEKKLNMERIIKFIKTNFLFSFFISSSLLFINQHANAQSPEGGCGLSVKCESVVPTCNSSCDGNIIANPAMGTGQYSFLWSTAQTSQSITNLCSGVYTVTVTDLNTLCSVTKTNSIIKGSVTADALLVNSTCDLCNGSITAIGQGGNGAPYTYLWSNGATSNMITGVCPNIKYTFTVTDKSGCTTLCSRKLINIGGIINDNNACTIDACDPSTGMATYTSVITNDNNICTDDGCDSISGVYHAPNNICCNGRFVTYTQGGWHGTGKPGQYLVAHFDACRDTFVLGDPCGYTIKFSDAAAVQAFLPQGNTAASLTQNMINPGSVNINVLAGQVLANGLALMFDQCDPYFGNSYSSLGAQVYNVNNSPFKGWSIKAIYDTARKVLSGCPSNYSPVQMNVVCTAINENYDTGSNSHHFSCPSINNFQLSDETYATGIAVATRPNPFQHKLMIDIVTEDPLNISITDIAGRKFQEYKNVLQSVEMNTDWNIGLYFIRISNESGSYLKVLKVICSE